MTIIVFCGWFWFSGCLKLLKFENFNWIEINPRFKKESNLILDLNPRFKLTKKGLN